MGEINLWSGIFTSDYRFDASAEFLLATKWFAQNSSQPFWIIIIPFIFSASIFIRFSATYTFSVGTGIMPLFLDHYTLHAALTLIITRWQFSPVFFQENWLIMPLPKYPTGFANSRAIVFGSHCYFLLFSFQCGSRGPLRWAGLWTTYRVSP